MIFDIKMDFTPKTKFVAMGHLNNAPSTITYLSVVSRVSVRIAFLLAALNHLDILAYNIGNAYLKPCREKVWFLGGDEPDNYKGNIFVIARALYDLKYSAAVWHTKISKAFQAMDFVSTQEDPDVYRKLFVRSGR